jgi:hypothetical protein
MTTHYHILGVAQDASLEEIQRSWRIRVQLLHPDRHHDARPEVAEAAEVETRKVNEAWSVLRDPHSRRRYDATLHRSDRQAPLQPRPTDNDAPPPRADDRAGWDSNPESRTTPSVAAVTCPTCSRVTTASEGAHFVACFHCSTGIRFAICPQCHVCLTCNEVWSLIRCPNCRSEFQSPWPTTSSNEAGQSGSQAKWTIILAASFVLALIAHAQQSEYDSTSFGESLLGSFFFVLIVAWLCGAFRRKR